MSIADHLFIIDATGSMSSTLKTTHQKAKEIAIQLRDEFPDIQFRFACICYRDPVDRPAEKHEFLQFEKDIEKLVTFLEPIQAMGGGDGPEDFVGAFKIALDLNWSECSSKSITLFADAPPHGKLFCGFVNHEDQTQPLIELLKETAKREISLSILSLNKGMDPAKPEFERIFKEEGGQLDWDTFDIAPSFGGLFRFSGFSTPGSTASKTSLETKVAAKGGRGGKAGGRGGKAGGKVTLATRKSKDVPEVPEPPPKPSADKLGEKIVSSTIKIVRLAKRKR